MPTHCIIPGCKKPTQARGWCYRHYQRNRRFGSPYSADFNWHLRTPFHERPTEAQRFFTKIEFTDSCWLWNGARIANGYGGFHGSKMGYAHRFAYEFCVGEIPEGLQIDHLCRVHLCVNPDHLEPVTGSVNVLRSPIHTAAINRAKTHCKYGHGFTEENTYSANNGRSRKCKTCDRDRHRKARV